MATFPIVVPSTKGGVAKSVTSRSLADAFGEQKKMDGSPMTVLVIDADPQQSLTASVGVSYGTNPWGEQPLTINGGTENQWWLQRGGTQLKYASVESLKDLFRYPIEEGGVDILLIDTGAFEPRIVQASLTVIKDLGQGLVISPIRPNTDDIPGFVGARSLVRAAGTVHHRGLLCDVERAYSETQLVRERVHQDFPGEFYSLEIPHDARVKDATGWGRTSALTNDPRRRSKAAAAYRQLAGEISRQFALSCSMAGVL